MRTIPTALALCLACGSTFAQQDPQPPQIPPGTLVAYSEYDLNGDGKVATTEFMSLVAKDLQTAARSCDVDADGAISQPEYDACAGYDPASDSAEPR